MGVKKSRVTDMNENELPETDQRRSELEDRLTNLENKVWLQEESRKVRFGNYIWWGFVAILVLSAIFGF